MWLIAASGASAGNLFGDDKGKTWGDKDTDFSRSAANILDTSYETREFLSSSELVGKLIKGTIDNDEPRVTPFHQYGHLGEDDPALPPPPFLHPIGAANATGSNAIPVQPRSLPFAYREPDSTMNIPLPLPTAESARILHELSKRPALPAVRADILMNDSSEAGIAGLFRWLDSNPSVAGYIAGGFKAQSYFHTGSGVLTVDIDFAIFAEFPDHPAIFARYFVAPLPRKRLVYVETGVPATLERTIAQPLLKAFRSVGAQWQRITEPPRPPILEVRAPRPPTVSTVVRNDENVRPQPARGKLYGSVNSRMAGSWRGRPVFDENTPGNEFRY